MNIQLDIAKQTLSQRIETQNKVVEIYQKRYEINPTLITKEELNKETQKLILLKNIAETKQ